MNADEWWIRWDALWWAIGWRTLAERSNYNVSEVLDMLAAVFMRLRRLEALQQRTLFGLMF